MRKPNLLHVFLYLIIGISFGFLFAIFVLFINLEKLTQVSAGLDVTFGDNSANNLILQFILISVVLLPLSIYLSRFYGKAKVFLIAVVMAAILTGSIFFYKNAKNSGIVQVKTVPANKAY